MPVLDCGVDIERHRPEASLRALGRHVLTPAEQALLGRLPPAWRSPWFTGRWTVKEAVSKAVGLGLALPFHEVGFTRSDQGMVPAADAGAASVLGPPSQWSLAGRTLDADHLLAVAVRGPHPVNFVVRDAARTPASVMRRPPVGGPG